MAVERTSLAELQKLLPQPAPAVPGLPTGISALDEVLQSGGLPRGRLTEIIGPMGSGKTTFVRAIVESTIRDKGWVAYIDAERTLDARDWTHLGFEDGFWVIRPPDLWKSAWCADILLRSGAYALVILDGAPTLTKETAVRLTRLARDSNAAFVLLGDRTGSATQLGGAVRLHLEKRKSGPSKSVISVRVEKGGAQKTVELECATVFPRRLATKPDAPDRRGVARGPVGGLRHGRRQRAASPPEHSKEEPIVIDAWSRTR